LFDARISGIDPLAKIKGNKDSAIAECKAINTGMSGCYHNDRLDQLRSKGLNVYFQGTVRGNIVNGKQNPPTRITIMGADTLGQPGGTEIISLPNGASILSSVFGQVIYAPKGLEILEQRANPK
jgi:hypothetical protein